MADSVDDFGGFGVFPPSEELMKIAKKIFRESHSGLVDAAKEQIIKLYPNEDAGLVISEVNAMGGVFCEDDCPLRDAAIVFAGVKASTPDSPVPPDKIQDVVWLFTADEHQKTCMIGFSIEEAEALHDSVGIAIERALEIRRDADRVAAK